MTHLLRCSACRLPYAKVYNGSLQVDSEHRGRKHTNSISIALLRTLMTLDVGTAIKSDLPRLLPSVEIRKVTENAMLTDAIALMCHDPECKLPWAYIVNGALRIDAQHGRDHSNRLFLNGLAAIPESYLGLFFLPGSILKGINTDTDENSS